MNKNLKTILLIIVIIIIIAIISIFGRNILNENENINETQNNGNQINQNMEITINKTEENVVNETTNNNISENKLQNTQTEKNVIENIVTNQTTEVLQNDGASNEEKAIQIVKKDWGTENGVYFVTMGIDASGRYIVTVNDSSTTATLAWYRSRCGYW